MIFPAIAFLLVKFDMGNLINDKPLALYAVVAMLNLLIMRYFYRHSLTKTGQGIILITFLIAMLLLFLGGFKIEV